MTVLADLDVPIIQAPMAGGVSTPLLTLAVNRAGALGFVAGGYLTADALREQIHLVRSHTDRPFGVNVFSPSAAPGDPAAVAAFGDVLAPFAAAHGVELGRPRFDDDDYDAKLALLLVERPGVVSFAFGCPTRDTVDTLHAAGVEVWVTVTDGTEAQAAAAVGADAVIAQGEEAGAHRGSFVDTDSTELPLLELLAVLRREVAGLPIVAAGGLMAGEDIAIVGRAGAVAAQLGTAFMLCPEAGTSAVHRAALVEDRPTVITRAFTGRKARSIVNAWTDEFNDRAPSAYPQIHYMTAPLRAHGRAQGLGDLVNLWAGTRHVLARTLPAEELVAVLAAELAKHDERCS
jgi:nitronate monooxygenase